MNRSVAVASGGAKSKGLPLAPNPCFAPAPPSGSISASDSVLAWQCAMAEGEKVSGSQHHSSAILLRIFDCRSSGFAWAGRRDHGNVHEIADGVVFRVRGVHGDVDDGEAVFSDKAAFRRSMRDDQEYRWNRGLSITGSCRRLERHVRLPRRGIRSGGAYSKHDRQAWPDDAVPRMSGERSATRRRAFPCRIKTSRS